jgi:hypothetical protein
MRGITPAAATLLAAIASCAPGSWETYRSTLPADQRSYMEKVDNNGPSARVAQKDHEAAWKRAEDFLTKLGGGFEKDAARQNRLKSKGGAYQYTIDSRKGLSDQDFSVMCTHSSQGSTEESWRNARIAQYYIATGELPFPQLVSK